MDFIFELEKEFLALAHSEQSIAMAAYMKNNFLFLGIPSPQRKAVLQPLLKTHSKDITANSREIAWSLFEKPQREFHYCAIEILTKFRSKKWDITDIHLIEKLLITHSWWDSVDTISKYLLGRYLSQFPEQTAVVIEKFSQSPNMWLNRSTILFQLEYKKNTNFSTLEHVCEHFKSSNEFFIQKAIGWALREYGKHQPEVVRQYVLSANLKPLSTREALRIIVKQKP